jgi:hypothetical protein
MTDIQVGRTDGMTMIRKTRVAKNLFQHYYVQHKSQSERPGTELRPLNFLYPLVISKHL